MLAPGQVVSIPRGAGLRARHFLISNPVLFFLCDYTMLHVLRIPFKSLIEQTWKPKQFCIKSIIWILL